MTKGYKKGEEHEKEQLPRLAIIIDLLLVGINNNNVL